MMTGQFDQLLKQHVVPQSTLSRALGSTDHLTFTFAFTFGLDNLCGCPTLRPSYRLAQCTSPNRLKVIEINLCVVLVNLRGIIGLT